MEKWNIKLSHGAKIPKRSFSSDAGIDIEARGFLYNKIEYWFDKNEGKIFHLPSYHSTPVVDKYFAEKFIEENDMEKNSSGVFIGGKNLSYPKSVLIKTGIQIEIPKCPDDGYEYEIQIRPRSGLALKNEVTVLNSPGTVDSSYRGDLGVILSNFSDELFFIEFGMRIAQAVVNKVKTNIKFVEVDDFNNTNRGEDGFGSTGK